MESAERIELLAKVPLFIGLTSSALELVLELGIEETFARDDVIFHDGDPGEKLYVVLSGTVRISHAAAPLGDEALAVLAPGSMFGEMSMLGETTRSADARAHGRCRLLVLDSGAFTELLFLRKDLAYEVLWNMARLLSARLRETSEKLPLLTFSVKP